MAKPRTPTPKWLNSALQGVTFWIGHRRALYSGYPLGESALVAELCNMIYAHLPSDLTLRCEVQYTDLIGGTVESTILSAKARADIVVLEKIDGKRENAKPAFIFEIKRASSSNAHIDKDLARLAAVKRAHPSLSTWLVVVAEAARPTRFVTDKGVADTQKHRIPETSQLYRVRRVFKAAHAFTSTDRAQYACLIEVGPPMPLETLGRYSEWKARS